MFMTLETVAESTVAMLRTEVLTMYVDIQYIRLLSLSLRSSHTLTCRIRMCKSSRTTRPRHCLRQPRRSGTFQAKLLLLPHCTCPQDTGCIHSRPRCNARSDKGCKKRRLRCSRVRPRRQCMHQEKRLESFRYNNRWGKGCSSHRHGHKSQLHTEYRRLLK